MDELTKDLALRIVAAIDPDGDVRGLSVPSSLLDPAGLSAWTEWELGDKTLAEAIRHSQLTPKSLLVERYAQSARLLGMDIKKADRPASQVTRLGRG